MCLWTRRVLGGLHGTDVKPFPRYRGLQFRLNNSVVPYFGNISVMKFIVGTSRGNVTCMALYLSIYSGRMEGPPSSLSSVSSYTPYCNNPAGSSTAVLSTATGTGGAAYGISVNNSYTAVKVARYPLFSRSTNLESKLIYFFALLKY